MTNPGFRQWHVFLLALLAPYAICHAVRQHAVEISNNSQQAIVVDWVNPLSQEAVPFTAVRSGETIHLNSFTNHTFIIHLDNNETCMDQYCRSSVITVNDNDHQVVKVKSGLEVEHIDGTVEPKFKADEIVDSCKRKAKDQLRAGYPTEAVLKYMSDCVEAGTAQVFQKMNEELMFEAGARENIASKVEDYTCRDELMETTKAEEIRQWTYESENITRNVHLLHERKASKIHLLEDFISSEECAAVQEAAAPILHRGTVADGKGGSKLSEHRKAMQAGIRIPWELEHENHPLTRLFRRIYAYANAATGMGLTIDGQEDLMSIQYFGRGEGDKAPDRYKPHCDGDCNGLPHKTGGRVATMVMYCDTEGLVGGATNFGNAGVFVRPKVGAAAFFSYLDPETHIHETGFTTHSGCPVIHGNKKIAVHWLRSGVDKERPWDSFDTNNVHKSECEDD